jgi:hypothetical protein
MTESKTHRVTNFNLIDIFCETILKAIGKDYFISLNTGRYSLTIGKNEVKIPIDDVNNKVMEQIDDK